MAKTLRDEEMWHEVAATSTLLTAASPDVRYRTFTGREERTVGTDWLWWWIDATGTSFGLLTQTKILKRISNRWDLDFGYHRTKNAPTQIDTLLTAAEASRHPPAHPPPLMIVPHRPPLPLRPSNAPDRRRTA